MSALHVLIVLSPFIAYLAALEVNHHARQRAKARRRAMAIYPPRRTPEPPRVRRIGALDHHQRGDAA